MDIPKFHETFSPILKILKNGNTLHHKELLQKVIEENYSNLPKELLELKEISRFDVSI